MMRIKMNNEPLPPIRVRVRVRVRVRSLYTESLLPTPPDHLFSSYPD